MAENTKIEWANHSFNPWRGCSKVHTGCANCYAEATSKRNETILGTWGPNGTRVVAADRAWLEVFKWNASAAKAGRRDRVFCASLADVFEDWSGPMLNHEGEPLYRVSQNGGSPKEYDWSACPGLGPCWALTMNDVRRRLFGLIDATPSLDWLLLTKRPENVRKYWPSVNVQTQEQADERNERGELYRRNVWIGTSISDQETMETFLPALAFMDDLAPVRFVSAEPLVGPIDFSMRTDGTGSALNAANVNLVIVGGESGPGARPCSVEWVRDIVRQCTEANVACFVKQLGANVLSRKPFDENEWTSRPVKYRYVGDADFIRVEVSDPKAGKPDEWPEDLRVRQMPEVCR